MAEIDILPKKKLIFYYQIVRLTEKLAIIVIESEKLVGF